MSAPFDLQTYTDEKTGNKTYSFGLSFRGMDENEKLKKFYNKLLKIDDKIIDDGVKNSKKWFKQKYKRDVVKAFYNPIVKQSMTDGVADGKYPPSLKLKLPKMDNKFTTIIFNNKKEELDLLESLTKGCKVKALLEFRSIWFSGSKFGIVVRPIQLKVKVAESRITGFAFIEDSESDDDDSELDNIE